jgi:hypothetical protein
MNLSRTFVPLALVFTAMLAVPSPADAQVEDPFLWLEEVEGQRAMEWVLARNAETRAQLESLPTYRSAYESKASCCSAECVCCCPPKPKGRRLDSR